MAKRTILNHSVDTPVKQIVAIGGGGFSAGGYPAIEAYVLAQTRVRTPRVCFVATATGDADSYVAKFYEAFTKLRCKPTHLPLFARTPDVRATLMSQDAIYVGGGNTKSMLAVWREWGIHEVLRDAWAAGVVLAGISAGAICWFDVGITDSWAGRLAPLPCLGFLPGAGCPHYDGEVDRRPTVLELVAKGTVPATVAIDDGAAAHFIGRRLSRVVTWRPGAGGYMVRRRGGRAIEKQFPVVKTIS